MTSIISTSALTTYERAKARLNVSGVQIVDATDQESVEALVNAVSDAAANYCGSGLAKLTRTEVYAPPRGRRLILGAPIIASVSAVTLDGQAVTDYVVEDAAQGWLWRDGGWRGETFELAAYGSVSGATIPGTAQRVLSVTYLAGYVTPSQAAASPTGGATLSTREGSGAGSVTGTAGATGTLTVACEPGMVGGYDVSLTWGGGAPLELDAQDAETLTTGLDLGSLDVALLGLTWGMTTAPLASPLAESWAIVPTVAAPTRTLPWDVEEAVLDSVAAAWRVRNAGNAQDASSERNTSIGRGVGGLLTDRALDVLAAYRRLA